MTYVSDTYGGSASDRQMVERSALMKDYPFKPEDKVMADRGIMVQDLFAHSCVRTNTPHKLQGNHQLDAEALVADRRIASKRILIERIIGLGKTFKILTQVMNGTKVALADQLVNVCMFINNFRPCIVGKFS